MNEDKRRLVFNTLEDLSPDREVLVHNYIKQLENNWNELKKWIGNRHEPKFFHQFDLIEKMKELEQGKDDK